MEAESGRTKSLWHDGVGDLTRVPLGEDARADVCIVGAGIAGMMTAYALSREGRRVLVLDDGPIGGGETGRTTAHLSDALDDRYSVLERLHGSEGARLAADSHRTAIDRIEEISRSEGIDCDFARVDGFLFPSTATSPSGGTTSERDLREELAAAVRAGVAAEWTDSPPCSPFGDVPALRFPRQARVHSLKLLDGLARCVERDGGRIHTGTHVKSVTGGSPVRIETDTGLTVLASACVVATNSPISDYVVTHVKQAPYRTFAVAARVPRGSVPDALYWDDGDPYIYIRLQQAAAHDYVIVGGEDYKTGQKHDDRDRLDRLEAWTRERFPMLEAVEYRWSGQVLEPADGLAFIGRNPDGADGVFIVTGDSGHGMTHGTIAGLLLPDLIGGRPNPWEKLYDPRRISLGSVRDLARENLNVAAQYADWIMPGDAAHDEPLAPGTGRVERRGPHMVAVYRAEDGSVTERSAACTHLRCVVHWNQLEKSWDCPCHGSRFGPTGEVLSGPAMMPLERLDDETSG